jgi:predicted DNA binding CopG/RHH family protein
MQTTLRIDDRLYREAKAEAAREGMTLTKFIEDGIRVRLTKSSRPRAFQFRVYDSKKPFEFDAGQLQRIADEEQEKSDLKKLGLTNRQ